MSDSSDRSGGACGCGRAIDAGHAYCPACGRPASGPKAGALQGSPVESLELLGGNRSLSITETTVQTGRSGRVTQMVALGLGTVALVLVWSLFRQPAEEIAPESAADPAPETSVAPQQEDSNRDQGTGQGGDEGDDRGSGQGEGQEDDAATTAVAAGTGGGVATPPLLGEPTGLFLVASWPNRTGIEILDLDTGEMVQLDRTQGEPIGAMGTTVVLRSSNTGLAQLVDIAEPGRDPIDLRAGPGGAELVEIADDRVWLLGDGPEGPVLSGVGATGEVVEELDFPVGGVAPLSTRSLVRPSILVNDPGGGLYRRVDEGYERVAQGQVLAAGERVAVIRQCDDDLTCQLRWYDLRSSGLVGFPAPPPSDGQGFYMLAGGDRWLFHLDWGAGEGRLIEVATARVVRTIAPENFFTFESPVSISDDGRWLIERNGPDLVVVDLDSGEEWPTGLSGQRRQAILAGEAG